MKNIIFCLLTICSTQAFSQTMAQVDSVSFSICDYLKTLDSETTDAEKMDILWEKQMQPYLITLEKSAVEAIGQRVFFRLQRNCPEFGEMLDRLEPPKDSSKRQNTKPLSTISKKDLKEFKQQEKFYYFEVNGDTTFVTLSDGIWLDNFTDKTFSKLSYKWLNKTEFELTFIESNNKTRANFSLKGDNFVYNILSKKEGYYLMSVNIPGQKSYIEFRFHYK